MRLIRFGVKGQEKPGVLIAGKRRDASAWFRDWDAAFFAAGGLKKLAAKLSSASPAELPEVGGRSALGGARGTARKNHLRGAELFGSRQGNRGGSAERAQALHEGCEHHGWPE